MTTSFHVTTPLGARTVDSPSAVTERISEYMKTEGSALTNVEVTRASDQTDYSGAGDFLNAADFWPELIFDGD